MKEKIVQLLSIVMLAALLALCSCSPKWQAQRLAKYCAQCPQSSHTITETVYRDSTIYLPADSSLSVVVINCDSGKPVIAAQSVTPGKKIHSGVRSQNTLHGLQITLESKTSFDSVKVAMKETKTEKQTVINATVPCPPCTLSSWNRFMVRSGYAFYGLLTMLLAYIVGRLYLKFNTGGII